MTLTAYSLCTIYARNVTTLALSIPVDVINAGNKQSYTSGTGSYQVNKIYYRSSTLNASAQVTFNLKNGSLLDNLGNSLVFSKIRMFYFYNSGTATDSYCTIATFAGSSIRHALMSITSAPIKTHARSQVFLTSPTGYYSAGTYLKLKASTVTITYTFMIVGI